MPGPSIVSQETAISGSFQQNLASVCNGVSLLEADYGMDPQIWQSLDGPSFHLSSKLCLLTPSMGVLFPGLRRGIVSQETAISRSFQQNLASVYNGVIVWRLIMGWIPGYVSL